jgi:hypothetical protein
MESGPARALGDMVCIWSFMVADLPFLSVCITTRGRPRLLARCLESLLAQEGEPPFELLVCCQGDARAAKIVRAHFPDATIGLVEQAYPGGARNFLIERARGELLVFLDDDVSFGPALMATIRAAALAYPDVTVFGGPNLTPPKSTMFQHVQGAILGSLLATGPVRRRYGQHPACFADERYFTLCNMVVSRREMVDFPTAARCAEENVVLAELEGRGLTMRYDPDIAVFHNRRETWAGFARQINKYGFGRGQAIAEHRGTLQLAHAAPVLLILSLCALPFLAAFWTPWWLGALAAYFLALLGSGVVVALTMKEMRPSQRAHTVVLGAALTAIVHLWYGVGLLGGLVRRLKAPDSQWVEIPLPPGPDEPLIANLPL